MINPHQPPPLTLVSFYLRLIIFYSKIVKETTAVSYEWIFINLLSVKYLLFIKIKRLSISRKEHVEGQLTEERQVCCGLEYM